MAKSTCESSARVIHRNSPLWKSHCGAPGIGSRKRSEAGRWPVSLRWSWRGVRGLAPGRRSCLALPWAFYWRAVGPPEWRLGSRAQLALRGPARARADPFSSPRHMAPKWQRRFKRGPTFFATVFAFSRESCLKVLLRRTARTPDLRKSKICRKVIYLAHRHDSDGIAHAV